MEEFRDIQGYEGLYQVSNLGRVKSLIRGDRILKSGLSGNGYKIVCLCKDRKQKRYTIHQLVAIAFLGHNPNGMRGLIVDHVNGVRNDNRLENLQLITQRENIIKDKPLGSSKYTGVSWNKSQQKWYSQISIKGKPTYLGRFKTEEEAHQAYQDALLNL